MSETTDARFVEPERCCKCKRPITLSAGHKCPMGGRCEEESATLRSDETRRQGVWIVKHQGYDIVVSLTVSSQKVGSEGAVLAVSKSIVKHLMSWLAGKSR